MISKNFQFYDPSERYYSYVSQERFYEAMSQHPQLRKVLLTKHSVEKLQNESKELKKMMVLTGGGSVISLYPFSKYVSFGNGIGPSILKFVVGLGILVVPSVYVVQTMRSKMVTVKKNAYEENRPNFRKFELTGDIMQVSDRF
mgnify:CR=1 FL=1